MSGKKRKRGVEDEGGDGAERKEGGAQKQTKKKRKGVDGAGVKVDGGEGEEEGEGGGGEGGGVMEGGDGRRGGMGVRHELILGWAVRTMAVGG